MHVQDEEDEEYDPPLCHPKLKSVREALTVVDDLVVCRVPWKQRTSVICKSSKCTAYNHVCKHIEAEHT